MLHYSCDRCHQTINDLDDIRYLVKIEVQLAVGAHQEMILRDATVEELEQLLKEVAETVDQDDPQTGERTFDLCSQCYGKYIANPLALEAICGDFSNN